MLKMGNRIKDVRPFAKLYQKMKELKAIKHEMKRLKLE
jgi:hypothetical protein